MVATKKQILLDFFPKQQEFLAAVFGGLYTVVMYGGSIRGGKTAAGIGALILLCKKYKGSRWAIVRTDLQTLKRNTIPSFFKFCPDGFIKSYNQDTQTVTFTNGSQILFFGENYADDKDMNRWKGLEVNGFLLEEINELQEQSFYKAIERAGAHVIPNKPKPLIMCTCNPANNWVKELFYDRWKTGTLPDKWLYIPSKIFDNPFVTADAAYMESLKTMPRYEYEVFVNGDWDLQIKRGNEFYKEFNFDKHVQPAKYNPLLPLWLSIDENVNPYLSCSVWQVAGKQLMQVDEFCMRNPNNTVEGLASEFIRRYPTHHAGLIITGDATSRKEDVKIEKGYNLYRLLSSKLTKYNPVIRTPTSNASVYMRGLFINSIFHNGYAGISISIGEHCKETINDIAGVQQAEDGAKAKTMITDAKTKVRYQQYGHLSDTLDYIVTTVFSADYAKYQAGSQIGKPSAYRRPPSKNSY